VGGGRLDFGHAFVSRDGRPPYDDYEDDPNTRIVYVKSSNGNGWNYFTQALMVALFLAAGAVIWNLSGEVQVLKYKCPNQPLERGYESPRQP